MAESSILDHRGMPMRRAVLGDELAGPTMSGVRSIISGHPAQGITPARMAQLLRSAEEGDPIAYLELAEEMEEKDLHYLSVMGTRKRAVAQIPRRVEPADDSPEAKKDAELVEKWLDRDMLETELFDILDAIGKGYSATEIIWETKRTPWQPKALKWRDPRWFEFDRIDGETLRLRGDGGLPLDLEPFKFIVHLHPAKSGIPMRGGLARAVAWGWMFKNYAIKDWVAFLEMYGQPIRTGRFDPGASEADIRKLMRAVAAIGSDAAAVFPRTMDIEFIDSKAGTAPNELWRSMAEYIDEQVSKVVLGQTSSSDAKAGGLGSGQANLHGDVRDDLARADAKLLAATLNRDLVIPLVSLNHGARDAYPRIVIEQPDAVDVQAQIEAAEKLAAMGVEIDAEEMREMAGLPAPKSPDAMRLKPRGAQAPETPQDGADGPTPAPKPATRFLDPLKPPTGANDRSRETPAAASALAGGQDPDQIDRTSDEAIDDWELLLEAAIGPVETALAGATSTAEAIDILAGQLAGMDVGEIRERLARSGFAARLQGEIDAAADEAR